MINFTTQFTRLGALAAPAKDLLSFQLGTWTTDALNIATQYPAGYYAVAAYNQNLVAFIASLSGSFYSLLQQTAQQTVQQAVQLDSPPGFSANSIPQIGPAIQEWIRQMIVQGVTIQRCTVTAVPTTAPGVTNVGNGAVVMSNKRADGLFQENLFAETTIAACSNDAQQGNTATAGNETFSWAGLPSAPSFFDPTWPLGSGASSTWNTISALYNNSNGNVLQNGQFNNWTGNTPNNWTVLNGSSQISESLAQFYTGNSSMKWAGSNSVLPSIVQQFNSSAGTGYILPVQTQFAWCTWLFLDSVPNQGILEVALVDQNGNITTDSVGTQNVCTFNLPALARGEPVFSPSSSSSASSNPYPPMDWTPVTCVFRTSDVLSTEFFLRYRLTTALSAGTNLYFDQSGMGIMNLLYTGGPSIMTFDGSTHFIAGGTYGQQQGPPDQYQLTMSNNRGGAANLATFQTWLWRSVTIGSDILFPSANSPSVSDGLIVG